MLITYIRTHLFMEDKDNLKIQDIYTFPCFLAYNSIILQKHTEVTKISIQ